MSEAELEGAHRRRRCGMTWCRPGATPRPDLVKRDFTATEPNRLWMADMTKYKTGERLSADRVHRSLRLHEALLIDQMARPLIVHGLLKYGGYILIGTTGP